MLMPEGVLIDGKSGALSVETGRYTKRLSELRGRPTEPGAVPCRGNFRKKP
ncbi:hypothetical protein AF71_00032950 [Rhizobium sp. 57MFTsu3.2]|nr:hypothetical protein [Rhizobium sp. 57MFTsu3.2]